MKLKVFQAIKSNNPKHVNCDTGELVLLASSGDFMVGMNSRVATSVFSVVEKNISFSEYVKMVFDSLKDAGFGIGTSDEVLMAEANRQAKEMNRLAKQMPMYFPLELKRGHIVPIPQH